MDRGYYKIWRKIEDNQSWSRGLVLRGLMITILNSTHYKDTYFLGHLIEKGSFAVSVKKWTEEVGIQRQNLQRYLKILEQDNFIKCENMGNQFTKITVQNWELYQDEQKNMGNDCSNENSNENSNDTPYIKKEELKEIKSIKKETTEKGFLGLIENYTSNLELRTTLLDFMQMRKVIKKPMTERALTLLFEKLIKAGNEEYQISVLEQSILNNWQDIYKLRTDSVFEKKYEDFGKKYEKIDIQEKSKQNCQDFLAKWEAAE